MKRTLIVTTASPDLSREDLHQEFTAALNNGEGQFDWATIQDILFEIKDGRPSITVNGKELHEQFSAVHLRNNNRYPDFSNAMRVYCDAHDVYVVNRADSCLPYYGKLSQGFLLALNGIPTPGLISSSSNQTLLAALEKADWQFPFVVKHNGGIRGVDNYLVKNSGQLHEILGQKKQGFVAQPFIENKGELRVLTFGTELPPLVFQKTAVKGAYLNNTSQGGSAELRETAKIPKDIMQHAVRAAELTGRNIGGVDVLLANDGRHMILEVNSTPSLATGAYTDEKLQLYRQYFKTLQEEK